MNGKTVVVEGRPARVAGRGDRRPVAQGPQDVRQRRCADGVDRAGPALRLERPAALGRALRRAARSRPPRARAGSPPRGPCRSPPRPRSPRSARIATAVLPTPPVAPVTRTGPSSGSSPRSSRATTLIAAVKPAVPIAIASRVVSPAGSGTTQLRRDPLVRAVAAVPADPEVVAVGDDAVADVDRVVRRSRRPRRRGRSPG